MGIMTVAERYRELILRLPLAIVFLWFGIDKFYNPTYWFMWIPQPIQTFLEKIFQPNVFPGLIYSIGVFEVLLGLDLLLGFFVRYTAAVASLFLLTIIVTTGPEPSAIRDIGLLGLAVYIAILPANRVVLLHSLRAPGKVLVLSALLVFIASAPVITGSGMIPLNVNNANANDYQGSLQPKADGTGNSNGLTKSSSTKGNSLLVFLTPREGETMSGKNVGVRLNVSADLKKLGLSHIHFKLDGVVIDAVYRTQPGEVVREFYINPGKHALSAYIAYIDHTEIPNSKVTVNFTVLD